MRISSSQSRTILLSLLLVCLSGAAGKCTYRAKPEYERIFGLPYGEQMAEFHKLPADQQVDMFLHAMYREPPAYQYCDYLAMSGERVVLSILARLQEDNDYTKSALAAVLARMQRKRYYDLTTHPDILARLESECAKAKDKEYRNECENYVQEILGDK